MSSLDRLTDKQNVLLNRLAYKSDKLNDRYKGMTIEDIIKVIPDENTKKILQELFDAGLGSLRIKDVGNNSVSGFGAIAFTDDYGNTGFAFRGTDGILSVNDMIDNVSTYMTGTSIQSAQAEAFFDANMDPNGNNYLYGHSKGGELAENVYVNNYQKIKEVHLLNPQPINPFSLSLDQLNAMKSSKVDIVIVEGDYVWFLGTLPSYGNIRIAKKAGGDSHFGFQLEYDELGNIIKGNQPWWEFPAHLGLTVLSIILQTGSGSMGFVYNCTVRIVDFVKNDLIPAARDFILAVSNRLEQLGAKFCEFANSLKEFLGSVIDKAKNWFNAGYNYANANRQIMLNTALLRTYANRLRSLNKRISSLDKRIDGLYWKVSVPNQWRLQKADMLLGHSWRIDRCINYLEETAIEFEKVEQKLINYTG